MKTETRYTTLYEGVHNIKASDPFLSFSAPTLFVTFAAPQGTHNFEWGKIYIQPWPKSGDSLHFILAKLCTVEVSWFKHLVHRLGDWLKEW